MYRTITEQIRGIGRGGGEEEIWIAHAQILSTDLLLFILMTMFQLHNTVEFSGKLIMNGDQVLILERGDINVFQDTILAFIT